MDYEATAEIAAYVYTPLSQPQGIRVATLLPGVKTDPLRVSIHEHDLNDTNLQYEAVSYCWGSVHRTCQIMCDDRAIMVTENLVAALLRFRNLTHQRVLWIDSICIDQNAIEERNHQVKLMGNVYQRANRVLIWLGEEGPTTELAYSFMRAYGELSLSDDWEIFETSARYLLRSASKDEKCQVLQEFCETFEVPPPRSTEVAAFLALLDRPWFSRAWTYQECKLARERLFVTGSHEIQGSLVASFQLNSLNLHGEADLSESAVIFIRCMNAMYHMLKDVPLSFGGILENGFWGNLRFLLSVRRGTKAHDPRDIVYSLLGVASQFNVMEIAPDYVVSWQNLYTSVTRQIICNTKNLTVLADAIKPSKNRSSLPTWVPDWSQPLTSQTFSRAEDGLFPRWKASGTSVVHIIHNEDPSKLQLRGLRCDRVKRTDLSRAEINEHLTSYRLPSKLELFDEGHKNFVTERGLLGVGPQYVEISDSVYILLGSRVPHLLRKAENENEFSFVGECHVHDLMQGEALLQAKKTADPSLSYYDASAFLWSLCDLEDMPFETEEVILI